MRTFIVASLSLPALVVAAGCGAPDLSRFTPAFVDVEVGDGSAHVAAFLQSEDACGGTVEPLTTTINGAGIVATLDDDHSSDGLPPSLLSQGCTMILDTTLDYVDDGATEDVVVSVDAPDDEREPIQFVFADGLPHVFFTTSLQGGALARGDGVDITAAPTLSGYDATGSIERPGFFGSVTTTSTNDGWRIDVDDDETTGPATLVLTLSKTGSCGDACGAALAAVARLDVTIVE